MAQILYAKAEGEVEEEVARVGDRRNVLEGLWELARWADLMGLEREVEVET